MRQLFFLQPDRAGNLVSLSFTVLCVDSCCSESSLFTVSYAILSTIWVVIESCVQRVNKLIPHQENPSLILCFVASDSVFDLFWFSVFPYQREVAV